MTKRTHKGKKEAGRSSLSLVIDLGGLPRYPGHRVASVAANTATPE